MSAQELFALAARWAVDKARLAAMHRRLQALPPAMTHARVRERLAVLAGEHLPSSLLDGALEIHPSLDAPLGVRLQLRPRWGSAK